MRLSLSPHPQLSVIAHKRISMFIGAIVFLLLFAQVVFAQQPTPIPPDPKLTPGDALDVTANDLCVPGYTKKVRNVPAEMKGEVYRVYSFTLHAPGDYEVDHLIPLELGGSNSIKNLWPESAPNVALERPSPSRGLRRPSLPRRR
jgi:hypothetical protein